ncbi:TetR/AcrR family transcriptional regulator [Rhodococcoides fascians]|uniref:TetR/AcrR family transcriptional regulator n=1 Tax=Rhodococcoides fascians TaxID=1828 RepID=UPI00389A0440
MDTGPTGMRRGRGARERLLNSARELFRERGINNTGMDMLSAEAQVSKRTIYQHFGSKDEVVAECLRTQDLQSEPGVFGRTDLSPREHIMAAFEPNPTSSGEPTPMCPFIGAAVEITDPEHPAREVVRTYKLSVAQHFSALARMAGAHDPDVLGQQLALLLDGASIRTRALGVETLPIAAAIARELIDNAVGFDAQSS